MVRLQRNLIKMKKAKNNQGKEFFSYKNDDVELVEISQFLRDTTKWRVEREWYVFFFCFFHRLILSFLS